MSKRRDILKAFRVNEEEAKMLDELRKAQERTESSVVRFLIREAHFKMEYQKTRMSGGT